jgi:hypothetical protein
LDADPVRAVRGGGGGDFGGGMMDAQWWSEVGQWEQYFNEGGHMGYKVHEMKDSKFLKKEDVGTGMLVTIASIDRENVAKEGADPEMKFVMRFEELDKPLVLNQTNIQACQMACGGEDDTDAWVGHKIVLYDDPNVSYAGKITGGIRLRAPKKAVQQAIKESKEILSRNKTPPKTIEELEDDIPF